MEKEEEKKLNATDTERKSDEETFAPNFSREEKETAVLPLSEKQRKKREKEIERERKAEKRLIEEQDKAERTQRKRSVAESETQADLLEKRAERTKKQDKKETLRREKAQRKSDLAEEKADARAEKKVKKLQAKKEKERRKKLKKLFREERKKRKLVDREEKRSRGEVYADGQRERATIKRATEEEANVIAQAEKQKKQVEDKARAEEEKERKEERLAKKKAAAILRKAEKEKERERRAEEREKERKERERKKQERAELEKNRKVSSVGGQAVIEGVMMRGKHAMATAVRDPEGKIEIESERLEKQKDNIWKKFFFRGIASFASSLLIGNKVLTRSAEVAEGEDEVSKAEKWLAEKHKIDTDKVLNGFATVLGVILAIGLFILLPQFLVGLTGLDKTGLQGLCFNLLEGGLRIAIFVAYLSLISLLPTMKRVFMYHGAEHKVITCYEYGFELSVKNAKECPRIHDRCGTTFLFIVMLISILLFSLANSLFGGAYTGNESWDFCIRIVLKLLLFPFVAGFSYEVLRVLARHNNRFVAILKAPGMLLQKITTKEPDERMLETAIAAFERVMKMDEDESYPESMFATSGKMQDLFAATKARFIRAGIEVDEAEWIFSLCLGIPKSAVQSEERIVRLQKAREIVRIIDERLTGRPLWYVIGDADFYGYKIKVDERVLIPRRETEELAYLAVSGAEAGYKILDLCTGSGALAIAIYKELKKQGKRVDVTASDISEEALELARENAEENGAQVRFVASDLFTYFRGKFNMIVANPPYIPTAEIETLEREVKDFEPRLALDGGADGLNFYRRIAEGAKNRLEKGGILLMEVGNGQAKKVVRLLKDAEYTMILKDMEGVERFVKAVY